MMALPSPASNQKWRDCLGKTARKRAEASELNDAIRRSE
jgi:hypothetical protein